VQDGLGDQDEVVEEEAGQAQLGRQEDAQRLDKGSSSRLHDVEEVHRAQSTAF
jgi:hypothetical protein